MPRYTTRQREALLDYLSRHPDQPLTVREIAAGVEPDGVSLSAVYRNLAELEAAGLIRPGEPSGQPGGGGAVCGRRELPGPSAPDLYPLRTHRASQFSCRQPAHRHGCRGGLFAGSHPHGALWALSPVPAGGAAMTRLSSQLPRLCRLDRLSVRSKRLAAVLAAVLLTLSLVTLPLFAAAEQNHACAREHCAICAQYQQLRQSTEPLRAPAAEPPALPCPRRTAVSLLSDGSRAALSPVMLRDKLSC